jgi:hypothetical protein
MTSRYNSFVSTVSERSVGGVGGRSSSSDSVSGVDERTNGGVGDRTGGVRKGGKL